jgi:ribonuclease P protein component
MTVIYVARGADVRVAYAVGRRVGPAVVRNRLRRQLRAAVREIAVGTDGLAPGAYLISARPEAAGRPYAELRADLGDALAAAPRGQASR